LLTNAALGELDAQAYLVEESVVRQPFI